MKEHESGRPPHDERKPVPFSPSVRRKRMARRKRPRSTPAERSEERPVSMYDEVARARYVADLRRQLDDGSYETDPEEIARRIAEHGDL